MKGWKTWLAMTAILGVGASASAQPCDSCSGTHAGQFYSSATETTVTGTVDDVKVMPPAGNGMAGLHLVVNTSAGPIDVHVGPTWYVSSRNVTFAKGETVTLVGSQTTRSGREVLTAREITKGRQTLTLRTADGIPVWSGHHPHHHGHS